MLLIGSQAMRYFNPCWASDRLDNVQDYDFICTTDEFKTLVKLSIQAGNRILSINYDQNKAIAKFSNANGKLVVIDASLIDKEGPLVESDKRIHDLHNYIGPKYHFEHLNFELLNVGIVHSNFNFVLKESHKYKKDSPHFLKTRSDLLWFYENGFSRNYLGKETLDVLEQREALTYTNKLPKLNQGKKEFFTDSVPYQYDHDTIHEAVKHLDKPAYMYYIKEGEQVMCDKDKWDDLDDIVKLYGVLEESYVLALERAIIPFGTDSKRAFDIALQKVCTSITSGWFREYAWDNYDKVQAMYHGSFCNKFEIALQAGKIAPYKKEVAVY